MNSFRSNPRLLILVVAALLTAVLAGCSSKPGAHITNRSDQPVTMLIAATGETPTDPGTAAESGETVIVPIPQNQDITLTALYSSGFRANSLFTQQELAEACKGQAETLQCRFNFTDQQFRLNAYSPAEAVSSITTLAAIVFAALLLAVTLLLFFRNRKSA